jgi:integrase
LWGSAYCAADPPPLDCERRWVVIVKWKLPTYLRQDRVKAFFSVVTSLRDKALFSTIYLYGLRVSEACLLQRDDVDLERHTIRIWRVKNGYSGEKPLFRRLLAILRLYSPHADR